MQWLAGRARAPWAGDRGRVTLDGLNAAPKTSAVPTWRDPGLWLVLLVSAALLVWSWSRLEGYQQADALEYLERADHLVRNAPIVDNKAIRSFGFSGLLVPFFAASETVESLTGFRDYVLVVHLARSFQILLTLLLVASTVRIGATLGGRGAGYAAGLMLGSNPIVLRWGVSPVSAIAAGLFFALAVEALIREDLPLGWRRRGWLVGLALGGSFMMAYKTLTLLAPLVLLVLLRRRRSGPALSKSMLLLGLASMVLAQCILDKLYYGVFGKSVGIYLGENVGSIAAIQIHRVGQKLGLEWPTDLAKWIYNTLSSAPAAEERQVELLADAANVRSKMPRGWYVTNLPHALTWPGIALVALGVARTVRRRVWAPLAILVVIALNVALMSEKGVKEYRLWLPFLSMVAVFGGLGLAAAVGAVGATARAPRRALAVLAVAAMVALGAREHAQTNTIRFGAFWRAISYVNREAWFARRAPQDPDAPQVAPLRVACSYHWAVYLRDSPDVALIKLPAQLDQWEFYDQRTKDADLGTIASLDWFIAHLPVLTERRDLLEVVNEYFAVEAAFFERAAASGMGPVLVMKRKTGEPGERTLYDTVVGADPEHWCAERELQQPVTFVGSADLTLLGVEVAPLAGDGYAWVTYHWYGARQDRDYELVDRITCPGSPDSWQNNHRPAYGTYPTTTWPPAEEGGWILSESYLVVPEAEPYRADGPNRVIGGAFMAGDLIPADLWFDVGLIDPRGAVVERLPAVRPADRTPVVELSPPGAFPAPDGWRTSPDGMTWVASFPIPVPHVPGARRHGLLGRRGGG